MKNRMVWLSLALNLVLVVLVFRMGIQLRETQRSLNSRIDSMQSSLESRIDGVGADAARTLENAAKAVERYELQPAGLDGERRCLRAELVLHLRQWTEDTAVVLRAAVGEETSETALSVEDGVCRGTLSIPADETREIRLEAEITGGGGTAREELGAWEDVFMLLPLRHDGGSWGSCVYREGELELGADVLLGTAEQAAGQAAAVDPVFRVYRNEVLAREIPAEISETMTSSRGTAYAPALPEQTLHVPCENGDTVRLTFFCKDRYGLGYEFFVGECAIDASQPNQELAHPSKDRERTILTWPE